MEPWKTLSRETAYRHSKWVTVENHALLLPDGRTIENWPWIITPDYINIAVLTSDGKFLCFRQTKYAVDGVALAPVGGYIDIGESPLAAAKRELDEETGFAAEEWKDLGSYAVDGNHGAGRAHLFLATGASKKRDTVSDDLEDQELVFLTSEELQTALVRGEFKVLSWTAVMTMALLRLGQPK